MAVQRRDHLAQLPATLLAFLVDGDWSRGTGPGDEGTFAAFLIASGLLKYESHPKTWASVGRRVVGELGELWAAHRAQIEAATPEGEEPWIQTKLLEHEKVLPRRD
jgi:hypothetical protein